jgi:hypothetical protein
VKVTAVAEREADSDDAGTMKRYAEEAILSGAGTLAPEKDKGDLTIRITLDRLDSHESWETKSTTEYRKIGSHQEWNEKKKKYETKDDYANVSKTVNVKVVSATLNGTYDITDKSGKIVDSGSLSEDYKRKFDEGSNAPPPNRVEDDLLKQAATAVAARLVPTQDRVSVIVPKGSFESYIPFAESNGWDRYLASVQAVPENRNQRQESFRQYALGVAKEGVAYATIEDRGRALELLREAVSHYETAMRSNPGEKIFSEAYSSLMSAGSYDAPLKRANTSLVAFESWSNATGGKKPATAMVSSSKAAKPKDVMTNDTLIEMSKAGLTEENLILAIKSAAETDFDTTPGALITLAKAGVSKNVIAAMQKKKRP